MFDGKAFGEDMVSIVRSYVERTVKPLVDENEALIRRIHDLEDRFAQMAAPVAPQLDIELINRAVAEAVAAIPAPQDGKSVTIADVTPMIDDLIAARVAGLPVPADGKSVTIADVAPMIRSAVAEAVAAIPAPVDGKDGVGLADALIDRDGGLVITMTDGKTRSLGRVVSAPFDLDDFDVEAIDERTIKLMFTHGNICRSFELEFPVPVYREVYREGESYARGDAVTWAGSLWIAVRATTSKPDVADSGWRLAVKSGRPGRDAKNT